MIRAMFGRMTRGIVCSLVAVVTLSLGPALRDGPQINDHFPVDERDLSPPTVDHPIHECALAVHVFGFLPKATVQVFAGGVEVGKDIPFVGYGDIKLTRPLVLGEVITAKQTVGAVTSVESDAVTVEKYPKLTTPVVGPVIYACGVGVPVNNLVASTHVEVSDLTALGNPVIGTGETTGPWNPVATSSLVHGHNIRAVQIACPNTPASNPSPPSNSVAVSPSPVPVPKPRIVEGEVIEGSDTITVHELLPGAQVEIKAQSDVISSGHWATGADNWFPLFHRVPPGHPRITATQTLCTTSDPSDPVFPTDFIPQPKLGSPICDGSRYVYIDDTFLNALVVLFKRSPSAPSPVAIGYVGATLGTLKMRVGGGASVHTGDILFAVQYIGSNVSAHSDEVTVGCDGGANVVTQHNDNFRTGAYLAETTLTPKAVKDRKMVQAFRVHVDGNVITQPLYVREVQFTSGGANGVFVGTMKNNVYALDANNGNTKWETPLQDNDTSQRPVAQGIQSTPVIDISSQRIYVLFKTGKRDEKNDDFETDADTAFWLVALRLQDGREVARVQVAASVWDADGSVVSFVGKNQTGHPALLFDHGALYVGFGSRADSEGIPRYVTKYHGWILQYRPADLALQRAFCTTPNKPIRANVLNHEVDAPGAGVWQGGGGLAADPDGSVYFLTGNGRTEWDSSSYGNSNSLYGDSFLKLTTSGGSLAPSAYAPLMPEPDQLEAGDADMGSGGPMVLPGFNYVIGGGKSGFMYLLDRSSMQLQQRLTASSNQYDPNPDARWNKWDSGPHLHGSPTYWPGPGLLYVWGEKDFLKVYAFNVATKKFSDNPIVTGTIKCNRHTMPGGMVSLSANGDHRGTGILWAIWSMDDQQVGDPPSRARLFAFNAETLEQLWDVEFGIVPHWGPPTIADGKVFVTSLKEEVIAYELGPDPNDLHWKPYVPKLAFVRCLACHTDQQREELTRRNPLRTFFVDEAAVWTERDRVKRAVAPPEGGRNTLVLEGNAVAIYTATASKKTKDRLEWTLKETTADLEEVVPEQYRKHESVRVRLSDGPVLTASDGSRIVGQMEKTTESPASMNAPWALYKVVRREGQGILTEQRYVQRVYTHAGHAPKTPPKKPGEVARVRYYAQYWFYR